MLLLAAAKSRAVMWDMPVGLAVLWYVLAALSVAVFLYGVARPLARYRAASREGLPPLRAVPARLLAGTRAVYAHRTIARRSRAVGWAHRAIFYGWCVLAAGTITVALDHDLLGPLFGVHILHGDFYLAFKAALNLLGTALVGGLLVMMVRRAGGPRRLDYARPDRAPGEPQYDRRRYRIGDWVFVVALLAIALTGFVLEGVRIAMDAPGYGAWQFGGWLVAQPLGGLGDATLGGIRHGLWWFHGLLAITFVAAIPYTKATHMLTSWASLVLRDPDAKRRLRAEPAGAERAGYATAGDVSALHLLQLDACTKCGRCHEVCPATATGRPLSPRDVVLELHEQVGAAWAGGGVGGVLGTLLSGDAPPGAAGAGLIGPDKVRPETAWACMQCNACVEVCPVGIEQAPIIAGLRRSLVEEGELEPQLQATLKVIHKSGNSFGENRRRRGRWTEELDFEVKDARTEPVELLWFVGDYASFDPRSQQVTRALATLLHAAGVDFGILYDGERNAGNDVRRVGEEGLFETLAEHNVATLEGCEFTRIVTTDPHSLNTLRNEYPALGGSWEVVHHTALLLELLESGRLAVEAPLGRRVTYHDPCYLGRVNGGFDAPRAVLARLGCELVEMPRNRELSFCCGAGGGRIWMNDPPGAERPSESRIREALALGPLDGFVVACPKDVTMYEDAIKTTGSGDRLVLREISELVLAATATRAPALA